MRAAGQSRASGVGENDVDVPHVLDDLAVHDGRAGVRGVYGWVFRGLTALPVTW